MGLIRCTCIYRATPADATAGAIAVASRDPWCPATDLHDRTSGAAEQPDRDDQPR